MRGPIAWIIAEKTGRAHRSTAIATNVTAVASVLAFIDPGVAEDENCQPASRE